VTGTTIDPPNVRPAQFEKVKITEETVEYPRYDSTYQKSRMGYYDEDGKQ
jgi:hypothetical protein